jgi:uncharacterized protein YjbI with pentapeptide repeats
MSTIFDRAQLDSASFKQTLMWEGPKRRYNYVIEQMVYNLRTAITVRGPSFEYANLRGAQFGNHALFGLVKNELRVHNVETVDFTGADLSKADLSSTCFFSVDDDGRGPVAELERRFSGPFILVGAVVVVAAELTNDDVRIPGIFSDSASRIGGSFHGATLTGTLLPPPIRHAIEARDAAATVSAKPLRPPPG